jgi:MscS family membrane protein
MVMVLQGDSTLASTAAPPPEWLADFLPGPLLTVGPFGVVVWQWLALLTLIPLSGMIGRLVGRPTREVLRRLVAKTSNTFDDELVAAAREPIILFWSVLVSRLLLFWIGLPLGAHTVVTEIQHALLIVAAFWMLLRSITVLQRGLPRSIDLNANPAMRSLIPLGGRIAKVVIFAIGVLTVISAFGYPIATILAGLGIGGIAIALGAQKSLEHFFGSVSIGVDQPFRIGDWIKAGSIEGEVEAIGLRSTRIRTIERTIITMPNGALAESQIENFGTRERIRLKTMIGLEYDTPPATIRAVRDDIEQLLRSHKMTWPDAIIVRFVQFGPSSLDLEVFCWLMTSQVNEFRVLREELYLGIIEIMQRRGAKFAFPTQTLHVASVALPKS